MVARVLLILFAAVISAATYAQNSAMLSLSGNVTLPIGEFKEALENNVGGAGVGFGTSLLINPKGNKGYSPVWLGADFEYITFGRDKEPGNADVPPYKTTFNYYSVMGVARAFFTDKAEGFTPFVDGMLGLKIFNTRTKIDKDLLDTVIDDQPEVIHTTNDNGLGYGVGLGFFNRRIKLEGEGGVSFMLRAMYLWGDKTSYVKRGSVKIETDGTVSYERGYTNTNMVLIQLGINIY